jgi:hypothetical protein
MLHYKDLLVLQERKDLLATLVYRVLLDRKEQQGQQGLTVLTGYKDLKVFKGKQELQVRLDHKVRRVLQV